MDYIVGSDEVGYGAISGSLIIGAVRAPADWSLEGLRDSKKLTPKRRQQLREQLLILAEKGEITYHLAERTHTYIDQVGVYRALKEAHIEAIKSLYQEGDRIIVDGILKFKGFGVDHLPIESMIKADTIVPVVMGGAILAKTFRDTMMVKLAPDYPLYNWEHNFGYPSKEHKLAIEKYGPSPYHRMSYRPMRNMVKTLPTK